MKIPILMASLVIPTTATADMPSFWLEEETLKNHFDNGVMHVNGREFLMGDLHEWPKATKDLSTSFMVRSSIWLREFLDKDVILKYQDFDIRRTRDSNYTGARYLSNQMKLIPDPPRDCELCYHQLTFDPSLRIEGYDTYSNGFTSLRFLPKDSEVSHGFRCNLRVQEGIQIEELNSCSVTVVYPYATNIVLNGYRFSPGTVAEYGANFSSIAERMLEVVTCIDITNNQNFDVLQLLKHHPNLTDCKIGQLE